MRKVFMAVCLGAILLLAGCRQPLERGVVLHHKFVAAHTEFTPMFIGETWIMMPNDIPDRWYILIHNDDLDRSEWIRVTKQQYDKYKRGDLYQREKN